MKRISFCLLLLFVVAFIFLGCASTNARTAIRDLENEGFTDICVFPTKEKVWPFFFVDKYTYVEEGVDTINSVKTLTGEICLRNVLTGERKTILPIPENDRMKTVCFIHFLKNDELFFSVANESLFTIYKYSIKNENLELIRHINLENDYPIFFSYLDEEKKCIYIEQEYESIVYCYDLYSDSPYIKKQQYEYIYDDQLYPFVVFNPESGQKEIHLISKYKDRFHIDDYPVKINDDEYLAVNRCGLYKSELCIVNVKTNTSRLFRLKDFGYEITWLFQVDEYEYCFIVCCQNKSTVLCYFTKDILESQ